MKKDKLAVGYSFNGLSSAFPGSMLTPLLRAKSQELRAK
jgi:hypothetical protein